MIAFHLACKIKIINKPYLDFHNCTCGSRSKLLCVVSVGDFFRFRFRYKEGHKQNCKSTKRTEKCAKSHHSITIKYNIHCLIILFRNKIVSVALTALAGRCRGLALWYPCCACRTCAKLISRSN